MARIEGPRSPPVGQIERKSVDLPKLDPPPASLREPKNLAPNTAFDDRPRRLVSMTGGYRAQVPAGPSNQELKDFVAAQMRGGVGAAPAGNTLSIKGAEAPGVSTKAPQISPKATPQMIEKAVAKRTMNEMMADIAGLSDPQKAALGKAIEQGKVTNPRVIANFIQLQPPADRAASMQKLPARSLEGLKELMRTGECPRDVGLGVGLRLASDSKWGKANPDVVKTMQKAYADGVMKVADADNKIAGLGMTSKDGISVADQLLKSPEGMAATLAHEGVHMHSGSGCCSGGNDATPAGELAGMSAGAEVWGELNKTGQDSALTPAALNILNESAAAKKAGEKPFKDKVLGWYTGFYQEKSKPLRESVNAREKEVEGGKKLGPNAQRKLATDKAQLEYLEKTAEAFRVAWKANG